MEHNYFPQRPTVTPTIYAYRLIGVDSHKGYLKVGYTDRTAKERIDEQLHTSKVQYEIVLVESAMSNDGSCFTDKVFIDCLNAKVASVLILLTRPMNGSVARLRMLWLQSCRSAQVLQTKRTERKTLPCALNSSAQWSKQEPILSKH